MHPISDQPRILSKIPSNLRDPLLTHFESIRSNYVQRRWESSELNGGKFAEVVFTVISDLIKGTVTSKPKKPNNMLKACQDLERLPADDSRIGDRSLRILIPRILPSLYEIRNNRNVGHVGGDVDPNFMDATAVYSMASWILAELVRITHNVPCQEAQVIVDGLVERKLLCVWEINGKKRILDPDMPKRDQVLVLLYQSITGVDQDDLRKWVEYRNVTHWKSRILSPLHTDRLIEWDQTTSLVHLSPLGVTEVETRLLPSYMNFC